MIDVTVPRRGSRPRPGIDIHRTRSLDPADVASVAGIPCTSIARTLLDLAEVVDAGSLRRACDQAEVLRIFDARALEDVLSRAHGRHGAPALRRLLDEHAVGQSLTRSELEERFLGLCAATGIARPEANAWIVLGGEAVQADFVWRPQRLVVETDGHRFHGTRQAFERDRLRDQRLSLAGWQVVRFTWLQLAGEPERVARTVRRLLARRSSAEVA